jgi:predicted TPR repeat methyltransferase
LLDIKIGGRMKNSNYRDLSVFGYDFFHNLEMDSYSSIAKLIKARINHSDRILEIGCGTGVLSNLISANCENIIGIDTSQKMLARAIRKK